MALKLLRQDDVAIIYLCADMDMPEVVSIKNAIATLIQAGCQQIVLDLSRVQHINATGLGILADSWRRLRALNGDLRLAQLNPFLQHIFEMTSMSRIFRIYKNRDEAVQSFKPVQCVAA